MEIAFIGVGFMGYGIALNLLKAEHAVRVIAHHNREPIEKMVNKGAAEASDYRELLYGAEVVFSCVSTAEQLEKVVTSSEPLLNTVDLWIDCTTSRPEVAEKMAALLKTHNVDFVDAPVTRSPADAEKGRLVSLVGAEPEVFQRVRPLIACYSESISHLALWDRDSELN